MNDEPKRVLVAVLPSGVGQVASFSDMGERLVADAERRLDQEKAEAERRARETIVVNRAWLLATLRDLISRVEHDHALAVRVGDYSARLAAARKLNRLRGEIAFCNAKEPPA